MKIIWESICEIGEYMNWVGLKKLCTNGKEWGGHGFIITSGVGYGYDKPVSTEESDAFRKVDTIILTPFAKELSWLYTNIEEYIMENHISCDVIGAFWASCKGFFLGHKQYTAEQLIDFVTNFISGLLGEEQSFHRSGKGSGE